MCRHTAHSVVRRSFALLRDIRDNGEGRLAMQPPPTLNTGLHLTWKINTCFLAQDVHTHRLLRRTKCQRHRVVATSPISAPLRVIMGKRASFSESGEHADREEPT